MRLADHSRDRLLEQARGAGLCWDVGPFRLKLRTRLADVVDGIRFLYGSYPSHDPHDVFDVAFHVHASGPLSRHVTIRADGETVYEGVPRRLATPMLEWTMNVAVFQRPHAYVLLHAAVVERDGRALVLCGQAGSGKSTLCAALMHRGWRLFSDEVAMIRSDDRRVVPVPRPISLKDASIDVIRRFAPEARFGPSWPGTIKGTVAHVLPTGDSVRHVDRLASLAWLVFPSYRTGAPARCASVPPAHALLRAADNAFNYSVLGVTAFRALAGLIERCTVADLSFGDLDGALEQLDGLTRDGAHERPAVR